MPLTLVSSGWLELEHFIEAYEAALLSDAKAKLADFLPDPKHPLYGSLLRELVCIDLEHCWRQGRPKQVSDYVREFPELARDPEALQMAALEESRWRAQAGAPSNGPGGGNPGEWPTINTPHVAPSPNDLSMTPPPKQPRAGHPVVPVVEHLPQVASSAPRVGERFLDFELLQVLGSGAFAKVYLARQQGMAGRLVVLKVSTEGESESHTLAQLQHTNIVPIYSAHRSGNYLAVCMPYFGTITLADLLRTFTNQPTMPRSGAELVSTLHDSTRNPPAGVGSQPPGRATVPQHASPAAPERDATALPGMEEPRRTTASLALLKSLNFVESVLWIGARLADGLAHAHERGILHRDLKPANVLLTNDGQPMLLDFNLAEDTKQRASADSALVGGTLPYMSPEQLRVFHSKKLTPVDARSDVYSLGLILCELLTGRYPFTMPRGSITDLLPRMIEDRERLTSLRQRNPQISPAVDAIIHHCLAPDPALRYQSARDLQIDLERQLAHQPLKVLREPSLRERAAKWRRRHPRLASITTLSIVAGLLLTMLGAGYVARGKSLQRHEAAETLRALEADLREAQGLLYHRQADERQLDEGIRLCTTALQRYEIGANDSWRRAKSVKALSEADQHRLYDYLGEMVYMQARATDTRCANEPAAEKRRRREEALALNELATSCFGDRVPRALLEQRADFLKNLQRNQEAELLRSQIGNTPPRSDRDCYLLGHKYAMDGKHRQALPLLEEATRLDPQHFVAWFVRGNCHFELMQDAQAVGCFNACISLKPEFYLGWHNRGLALLRQRRYHDALADFDSVLALRPDYQRGYIQRAAAREALGQLDKAITDLDAALIKGPAHNYLYLLRARVRSKRGDQEGAARDRSEAQRSPPTDEQSYVDRGLVRINAIPFATKRALPRWTQRLIAQPALEDFETAVRLNPRYFDGLQNLAAVLSQEMDRDADALEVMNRKLAWYPESVLALGGRGVLLARMGKREESHRDARAAIQLDTQPPTLYQVACIYALTSKQVPDDRLEAMKLLAGALRAGFGLDWIAADTDLDPLRELPEFTRLVKSARELHSKPTKLGAH